MKKSTAQSLTLCVTSESYAAALAFMDKKYISELCQKCISEL